MAGDARHASHVDADGRQDTAGPSAPAESLVARGALRHRARSDLVADPLRRPHLRHRLRLHRPQIDREDERRRHSRHTPAPQPVADFYREYMALLASLGIAVKLWPVPTEADHTIPFAEDRVHASYDAAQAHRFFQMLRQADRITKRFQGRFLGKSSPVHFFWG